MRPTDILVLVFSASTAASLSAFALIWLMIDNVRALQGDKVDVELRLDCLGFMGSTSFSSEVDIRLSSSSSISISPR